MQEKITFKNREGQQLAGVMHRPETGAVRASALFAHCFTCTKNIIAAVQISEALCAEGFEVLRFDFTGLGDSEGDFAETHFSANVRDLLDAAAWMAEGGRAPDLLVGHSLGGTAVLAAAHGVESAVAVAAIGSPADAEHVLHLLEDDLETIEREGSARVKLAGRPFRIRREFVEDVRAQSVRQGIRGLRRALLVMHSPVDEQVPIEQASLIYEAALHPKSFISLDKADHLLMRKSDSIYAGKVLAAWAARYIPSETRAPAGARRIEGAVLVNAATDEGFRVDVNANGHLLVGDEPVGLGGTDLGPTPYDYLSTALATCTAMTVNFFARRENLPLENVEVEVRHERIHAQDCTQCETESGRIDRFSRSLRFTGDLDESQRQLLLKIADRCPVHKTLKGEIRIENAP